MDRAYRRGKNNNVQLYDKKRVEQAGWNRQTCLKTQFTKADGRWNRKSNYPYFFFFN